MKEYVLSYYPKFKCVAGRCRHTCCAGWEMNIDKDSLCAYKNHCSNFKGTLYKGINFKKSKFKSDKKKCCAFLNDKGLCEIIINLGEQSLCQVCKDHPRFRSFYSDRIETGLGFACEEVAKIVLSFEEKIEPVLVKDDKIDCALDFNEQNVLSFRQKALDILQDQALLMGERVMRLLALCKASVSDKDFVSIVKAHLSFEKMDKGWVKRLKAIKKAPLTIEIDESLSVYCERFLVNSIFRHLSDAEDTMWVRARAIGCVFAWVIIQGVLKNETQSASIDFSAVVDVVRAYSAEVEYSEKNLDKLFSFAYKFIKI